jgi:hypothetical protein
MTPKVGDQLAKLITLATNPGATEGEALAALGRINAIAAANSVDWQDVFTNGSGAPALTEEQMSAIYEAAYNRGLADGQQQAGQPQPKSNGHIGAIEATRLERLLQAAEQAEQQGILGTLGRLNLSDFCQSMRDRLSSWGPRIRRPISNARYLTPLSTVYAGKAS